MRLICLSRINQSCSGKSGTPTKPDKSCSSGKPFQTDWFYSGKSSKPPSLISPAQANHAIRQTKEFFENSSSGLLSRFITLNWFLPPSSPFLIPGILAVAEIKSKYFFSSNVAPIAHAKVNYLYFHPEICWTVANSSTALKQLCSQINPLRNVCFHSAVETEIYTWRQVDTKINLVIKNFWQFNMREYDRWSTQEQQNFLINNYGSGIHRQLLWTCLKHNFFWSNYYIVSFYVLITNTICNVYFHRTFGQVSIHTQFEFNKPRGGVEQSGWGFFPL